MSGNQLPTTLYQLIGTFEEFDGTFAEPQWSGTDYLLGMYTTEARAERAKARANKTFGRHYRDHGHICVSDVRIVPLPLSDLDHDLFKQKLSKHDHDWRRKR